MAFRKIIRKLMMLSPGYRKAFFVEQKLEKKSAELKAAIAAVRNELTATSDNLTKQIKDSCETLFRNDIRCRWQVVDALDGLLFPPSIPVKCLICGHEAPKSTYETRVSECIFGGGRLERFVCPDCGCIFGPLKMLSLSQDQLGDEYGQSYSVYKESEVDFLERAAFEALQPVKGRVCLNYGAGAWNKTTKHLREEGYEVYDYEPYAPVDVNPWIIRSRNELFKRRFDGIFSNSVIEHLRNPVEDLRSMKMLLRDGGKMVHGTGCYEYAYEYTRFHLFFPVGRSLQVLAEAAGLECQLSDRLYPPDAPERICVFNLAKDR